MYIYIYIYIYIQIYICIYIHSHTISYNNFLQGMAMTPSWLVLTQSSWFRLSSCEMSNVFILIGILGFSVNGSGHHQKVGKVIYTCFGGFLLFLSVFGVSRYLYASPSPQWHPIISLRQCDPSSAFFGSLSCALCVGKMWLITHLLVIIL